MLKLLKSTLIIFLVVVCVAWHASDSNARPIKSNDAATDLVVDDIDRSCCCEVYEGIGKCGRNFIGQWNCNPAPVEVTGCAVIQDSCSGGYSDKRDDDVSTCKKVGDLCKAKSKTCYQSGPRHYFECKDLSNSGRQGSCYDNKGIAITKPTPSETAY
jgi:hypothetical protein